MSAEEDKAQFLSDVYRYDDITTGGGTFYAYYSGDTKGYLTAQQLRWLADEVDRLNAPLDKSLGEYLEGEVKGG